MSVSEIPTTLYCAKDCPFGLHCGEMIKKEESTCIDVVGNVIEGSDTLRVESRDKVHVLSGDVRLATVNRGEATEA